jgi:hypothetical protein
VNPRKEFYRDVRLEDIEAFGRQRELSAQFIHIPEAREYRETLAALDELNATAEGQSTASQRCLRCVGHNIFNLATRPGRAWAPLIGDNPTVAMSANYHSAG